MLNDKLKILNKGKIFTLSMYEFHVVGVVMQSVSSGTNNPCSVIVWLFRGFNLQHASGILWLSELRFAYLWNSGAFAAEKSSDPSMPQQCS